ncbi:Pr6Pr family membrane protein [Microbacterium sp.]|uniref:Pr6Pr family membrane protein n=1 Tax=Microbacterium sp. TaxID=51671 RepID=UPI00281260C2|nr:Pr6Pr family membrane protein [Microbacterium sp.]
MTAPGQPTPRWVGIARAAVGASVIAILAHAYMIAIPEDGANPFDYFGYFTNLTSLLCGVLLLVIGIRQFASRSIPVWLVYIRAIGVASMLVVALIYNVLVPGTGSAPPWVSVALHLVFPSLIALDWALNPDRPTLPWRRLWIVLPYPATWLVVVLARGVTDGWVPYGFLLPERGMPALLAHVVGLICTLLISGVLVWAASRIRLPTRRRVGRRPRS